MKIFTGGTDAQTDPVCFRVVTIRMHDVFISYSHHDASWIELLESRLKESGLSVWQFASMGPGSIIDKEVRRKLEQSHCVLVVWSPASVSSEWVKSEALWASTHSRLVSIGTSSDLEIPIPFLSRRIDSFEDWNGDPEDPLFLSLVETIKRHRSPVDVKTKERLTPSPTPLTQNRSVSKYVMYSGVSAVLAGALMFSTLWPGMRSNDVASSLKFNFTLHSGNRSGEHHVVGSGSTLSSYDLYWITAKSYQNAHLYVFQRDSVGQIDKLFPRGGNSSSLSTDAVLSMPSSGSFQLDDQLGRETLFFIGRHTPDACLDTMPERLLPNQSNPCPTWFDDQSATMKSVSPLDDPDGKGLNTVIDTHIELGCEYCVYYIEFDHI